MPPFGAAPEFYNAPFPSNEENIPYPPYPYPHFYPSHEGAFYNMPPLYLGMPPFPPQGDISYNPAFHQERFSHLSTPYHRAMASYTPVFPFQNAPFYNDLPPQEIALFAPSHQRALLQNSVSSSSTSSSSSSSTSSSSKSFYHQASLPSKDSQSKQKSNGSSSLKSNSNEETEKTKEAEKSKEAEKMTEKDLFFCREKRAFEEAFEQNEEKTLSKIQRLEKELGKAKVDLAREKLVEEHLQIHITKSDLKKESKKETGFNYFNIVLANCREHQEKYQQSILIIEKKLKELVETEDFSEED